MRYAKDVAGLVVLVLILSGCSPASMTGTGEKPEDEARKLVIPVEAESPTRGSISAYYVTQTRVTAEDQVEVTSEGSGQCLKVFVDEGDTVKAGQILAELDKREAQAQLRQQETEVLRLEAEFQRMKMLYEDDGVVEGLVSRQDYENAKYSLEKARDSLEQQRVQLGNLTVRAPIGGLLTTKNVQQGLLVTSGSPIFTIVNPNSYILEIHPPEKEIGRLRMGQVAEVTVDALPGETFEARVRKISPQVEDSGTVKVTLDFDREALKHLRYAAFTRVKLVLETRENVLLLAKDTLVEENARKYVFVLGDPGAAKKDDGAAAQDAESEDADAASDEVDAEAVADPGNDGGDAEVASDEEVADEGLGGTEPEEKIFIAQRVEVRVGLEDSNNVEILEGIDDGTLVVTLGQHNLKPGSEVKVTNAEKELHAKAGMSAKEALDAAKAKRDEAGGGK